MPRKQKPKAKAKRKTAEVLHAPRIYQLHLPNDRTWDY